MTTLYIEDDRLHALTGRASPYAQENVRPPRQTEHSAAFSTASHGVEEVTLHPCASFSRNCHSPARLSPLRKVAIKTNRMAADIPEISIHSFNPRIHQITCHVGHISPLNGCLHCLDLYEKLATYVPIDPRIQHPDSANNSRCSVYFKSPIGAMSQPAESPCSHHLNESRNQQNKLLHFHTRESNAKQTVTHLNEAPPRYSHAICVAANDFALEKHMPADDIYGPLIQMSTSDLAILANQDVNVRKVTEVPPDPPREYTRTPSITRSMRASVSYRLPRIDAGVSLTQNYDDPVEASILIPADDAPEPAAIVDKQKPVKTPTALRREQSKSMPTTPIKARKEARRIPAWSTAETPTKRDKSPVKKSKITPKRLELLEGIVQELRDEFGNLKLHVEQQDRDRDMTDPFFGN